MNPLISFSGTGRLPDQLVILDMKHGVEAKNYEEVRPAPTAGGRRQSRAVPWGFGDPLRPTGCALPRRLWFFSAVMWQPVTMLLTKKVVLTALNNNSACVVSQMTKPTVPQKRCCDKTFEHVPLALLRQQVDGCLWFLKAGVHLNVNVYG